MHFQYAFLVAHKKYAFSICIFDGSKIFPKYAFFHGKMHMFVYFLAGCRKRLLVLDCPSQRFAELCIFDGSKIFQKYALFQGKMHIFLLFGWLQKMHTSLICRNRGMYFTKKVKICIASWENAYFWKILKPSNMHIEKCVLPKNAD
jgi:hypothetical protein